MDNKPTTMLADLSRQPIRVGNPPAFIFNPDGVRLSQELVALSTQIRIAEALERIAAALGPIVVKQPILEPSPEELLGFEKGNGLS